MAVRVAIIGAGVMGADHAHIFAKDVPGAVVQIICDADIGRAKAIADATGALDASSDPFEAIKRSDVDAILVASPDATHQPLTLAALDLGKPVLCEKPMAPTSDECLAMIEAEIGKGKQLIQTGFMRRFDPAYREMKAALAAGSIGDALMFHCFHRNVSAPDWFTTENSITNSAPHEYDIARWLLDTEFQTMSVFRPNKADPKAAGSPIVIIVQSENGQLINIEVNINAAYGYDVRGEMVGTKGSVSLANPSLTTTSAHLTNALAYPADWRPRFAEAYRLQNQAWIRTIIADRPDPIAANAWDGYCATRIGETGVDALTKGVAVDVVLAPKPDFYA